MPSKWLLPVLSTTSGKHHILGKRLFRLTIGKIPKQIAANTRASFGRLENGRLMQTCSNPLQ